MVSPLIVIDCGKADVNLKYIQPMNESENNGILVNHKKRAHATGFLTPMYNAGYMSDRMVILNPQQRTCIHMQKSAFIRMLFMGRLR